MLSVSQHKKLCDKIERRYSVPLESYEAKRQVERQWVHARAKLRRLWHGERIKAVSVSVNQYLSIWGAAINASGALRY